MCDAQDAEVVDGTRNCQTPSLYVAPACLLLPKWLNQLASFSLAFTKPLSKAEMSCHSPLKQEPGTMLRRLLTNRVNIFPVIYCEGCQVMTVRSFALLQRRGTMRPSGLCCQIWLSQQADSTYVSCISISFSASSSATYATSDSVSFSRRCC